MIKKRVLRLQAWLLKLPEVAMAVAFFLVFIDLRFNDTGPYLYSFMSRDIDRARELLNGNLIFFGPETSGGGMLPGPFFYYLLAGALFFSPLWISCYYLLLGLFGAMALGGWLWLRKNANLLAAFLFLGLVMLSHTCRGFILLFLNPSYLLPFAFVAIVATCKAFSEPAAATRTRSFMLACLMIGLGLQLHFSIACLFLAILFMQILAPRLSLERLNKRALLYGGLIILVCCSPYLLWRFASLFIAIGQQPLYDHQSPGATSTLLLLTNYSLQVPMWVTVREALLRVFTVVPLSLVALIIVYTLVRPLGIVVSPIQAKHMRALFWILVWGFIPFSYVFLVHMGRRYGMVFSLSLIYITVLLHLQLAQNLRALRIFNVVLIVLLIVFGSLYYYLRPDMAMLLLNRWNLAMLSLPALLIFLQRREFLGESYAVALSFVLTMALTLVQYNVSEPRGLRIKTAPRLNYQNWVAVWKKIYRQTGWDYETARQRMYFVNVRLDEDPEPAFLDVKRTLKADRPWEQLPDGFFVINVKFVKRVQGQVDMEEFLLAQRIPEEIKTNIRNGNIRFGDFRQKGVLVVPYWVENPQIFPRTFHDIGQGYKRSDQDKILDQIAENDGTRQLAENKWLFKWNECPHHDPYCSTGALVGWQRENKNTIQLGISVMGSAISQNSPWVVPSWTQAWIEPYLAVRCDNRVHTFTLFSSIGFMRDYGSNEFNELLQSNNSVIAPFEREFKIPCRGAIQELAVGRKGSRVEQVSTFIELPEKRLVVVP